MANQTITVDFNANLARFSSSIDKATADLNRFQSNAARVSGQIKTAFSTMFAGLTIGGAAAFIKSTVDMADNMRDLAISAGTTTKALASYKLAAEQNGTSVEALASGLGKLSVYMGKNADEARKLGITADDPVQAFAQLSEVLTRIESPAQRAAVANEVLGKSYKELLPLLLQGPDALRQSAEAAAVYAERMEKFAEESDQFNDSLAAMKQNAGLAAITISGPLVSAMNEAFGAAADATKEFGALGGALVGLGQLGTVGQTISVLWANVAYVFRGVGTEIGGIAAQLAALASGDFKRVGIIGDMMKKDAAIARQELDKLERRILGLAGQATKAVTGAVKSSSARSFNAAEFIKSSTGRAKTAKEELDVLDPFYAQRKAALDARAREIQAFVDEQQASINELNSLLARDAQTAAEEYARRLASLVSDTTLAKTEALQSDIDFLNQAFFDGVIGVQQYDEAVQKLTSGASAKVKETADFAQEAWKAAAQNIEGALADFLFDPFDQGLDGMLKGFVDTLRRMAAEAAAAQIVEQLFGKTFGGGIVGGFISSIFGGAKAIGGPVDSNMAYLVGEKGPELFVPSVSGTIVPNHQMAKAGISQAITINVAAPNGTVSRESLQQMQTAVGMATARAIRRNT